MNNVHDVLHSRLRLRLFRFSMRADPRTLKPCFWSAGGILTARTAWGCAIASLRQPTVSLLFSSGSAASPSVILPMKLATSVGKRRLRGKDKTLSLWHDVFAGPCGTEKGLLIVLQAEYQLSKNISLFLFTIELACVHSSYRKTRLYAKDARKSYQPLGCIPPRPLESRWAPKISSLCALTWQIKLRTLVMRPLQKDWIDQVTRMGVLEKEQTYPTHIRFLKMSMKNQVDFIHCRQFHSQSDPALSESLNLHCRSLFTNLTCGGCAFFFRSLSVGQITIFKMRWKIANGAFVSIEASSMRLYCHFLSVGLVVIRLNILLVSRHWSRSWDWASELKRLE